MLPKVLNAMVVRQIIAAVPMANKITLDDPATGKEIVEIYIRNGLSEEDNLALAQKLSDLYNASMAERPAPLPCSPV